MSVSPAPDIVSRDLGGGKLPPLTVWSREGEAAQAIVLVGHGGSQERKGPFVELMAQRILRRIPAYVAAIDGPAHGDRRAPNADTRDAFIRLWLSPGGGVAGMVGDWREALAAVRGLAGNDTLPVGYYGVSMGTAFGVPFLASEPAITAAALGMWEDAVGGARHLIEAAPNVSCAVQFVYRDRDEFFSEAGARRLFDLLGSADKTLVELSGPHEESFDQIDQSAAFLAERLLQRAQRGQ